MLYLAIFLASLFPLLCSPIVPTVDFYDHVARYYVLSHLDDSFISANYAPRWAILPNIGMDIIGFSLARLIPFSFLAHVIVVIIFGVQYSGVLFLNRQLTGRTSLLAALLAAALLYSFIFTWGFANFLLGLGLALWGAGWWVATRHRLALAAPVACVIALVIFLTHAFAFGLYGLLLGGLEIGFFLSRKPYDPLRLMRRLAAMASQAVAPAILFRLSATAKAMEGVTSADESVKRLRDAGKLADRVQDLLIHRFMTVARVSEGPVPALDILTNGILLSVIAYLLLRRRIGFSAPVWPALAIGALAFAVMPPALFGVGYVADRIPLFVTLVAVAALAPRLDRTRDGFVALGVVAAVVFLKVAAIGVGWARYGADFTAYQVVRAAIPAHSIVAYSNFANIDRLSDNMRCEMYGPQLVAAGHATPLFVIPTAQPLELIGPLGAAMRVRPSNGTRPPSLERSRDRLLALTGPAGFEYVVVCDHSRVTLPPQEGRVLVSQAGRFALYRGAAAADRSKP